MMPGLGQAWAWGRGGPPSGKDQHPKLPHVPPAAWGLWGQWMRLMLEPGPEPPAAPALLHGWLSSSWSLRVWEDSQMPSCVPWGTPRWNSGWGLRPPRQSWSSRAWPLPPAQLTLAGVRWTDERALLSRIAKRSQERAYVALSGHNRLLAPPDGQSLELQLSSMELIEGQVYRGES